MYRRILGAFALALSACAPSVDGVSSGRVALESGAYDLGPGCSSCERRGLDEPLELDDVLEAGAGTILAWYHHAEAGNVEGSVLVTDFGLEESHRYARHALALVPVGEVAARIELVEHGVDEVPLASEKLEWERGRWYQVAATWGPKGRALYRDGALVARTASQGPFATMGSWLAVRDAEGRRDPACAEVACPRGAKYQLLDRILSAEEVARRFDQAAPSEPSGDAPRMVPFDFVRDQPKKEFAPTYPPDAPEVWWDDEKLALPPASSLPDDYKLVFLVTGEDPFDRVIVEITDKTTGARSARAYLEPEAKRVVEALARDPNKAVEVRAAPFSGSVQTKRAWAAMTARYTSVEFLRSRWALVPARVHTRQHVDQLIDWLNSLDPGPTHVAFHVLPHGWNNFAPKYGTSLLDSEEPLFTMTRGDDPTNLMGDESIDLPSFDPKAARSYPLDELALRLHDYRHLPGTRLSADPVFVVDACYSARAVDLMRLLDVDVVAAVDVRGARTSKADFTWAFGSIVSPGSFEAFHAFMPTTVATTNALMRNRGHRITFRESQFWPSVMPNDDFQQATATGWVEADAR